VEHPCYRCQALIEEGIAFCPHCGAPQIRVVPPEENMPATQPAPPAAPGEIPSPTQPPPAWRSGGLPHVPQANAIQWNLAWQGALLAGAGAGILSVVPIVKIGCCLWLLGAGALVVVLYQRRTPGTLITPGMGMRLGALTGVFAFVVYAVAATRSFLVLLSSGEFRRLMQEQTEKQMASNPDPKVQEIMRQMFDWINTAQGLATFMVMILLVMAVMFVVFCSAGGALGASMFGRRREFR